MLPKEEEEEEEKPGACPDGAVAKMMENCVCYGRPVSGKHQKIGKNSDGIAQRSLERKASEATTGTGFPERTSNGLGSLERHVAGEVVHKNEAATTFDCFNHGVLDALWIC
mmetsp:Transcript_136109/g.271499  ORF Transcript_136109/g.271499 Transcript_136109/m.271499 type:complete len:111 (+) Transcript_136109:18-350(+)